eukprot:gnl/MRDRNA2_/MRDRNA2_89851_c0_seq1.p1 gnl/MRDRNA2_/MRDRNA2_89851_c0~~gnl/MRDRNA2_/MRDRNA2_89851_c0_seq1.p1  ORF type:complete len:503 (-),score=103.30 gnl/MRDRNA2_/MRDRNA2_89851_c0_seq1:624-2132(-)
MRHGTSSQEAHLTPCTCHLVLLGRASTCKRELTNMKARRSSVPADDPNFLHEFKEARRHSTGGSMQPSSDLCIPVQNPVASEDGPGEVQNVTFSGDTRKPSKEQKMVQRKWSKNTTLRRAARTTTVTSLQDRSPRAPWDKFLKYFDRIQLEFIYEQFDGADLESTGDIGVADALEILAGWTAANYDLKKFTPEEDALQDVLRDLGNGASVNRLNLDLLVKFLRLCEAKVLQVDPTAGFKKDDLDFLQSIFDTHSKARLRRNADGTMSDEVRCSLQTTDVFAVLKDMGRDTSEVQRQLTIRDLISRMDVDCSGDLDFPEFLQFARRVRLMDEEEERELERSLVCNSEFSYDQTEDLLVLFQAYDELEEGVIQQHQFVDLVESNGGGALSKQATAHLKSQVQELGCFEDEDEVITFGQFLGIMKKLIDRDVCGLKTSVDKLEQEMKDDERFLEPEEYKKKYQQYFGIDKISWLIRKLIDKKVKNKDRLQKKRASKEKLTEAMRA